MRAERTGSRWYTAGGPDHPPAAVIADLASAHQSRPAAALPDDSSALYRTLLDADDRGDVVLLARLGWTLFTLAASAQQAHRETAGLLAELRAAAGATYAGNGTPASLAPLRHVLARHGWLPPRGASPLQVLAAPLRGPEPAEAAVRRGGRRLADPRLAEGLPR